ncbi:MAG: hydroxymethylbilane synthase, partial [Pseudomonadales bacterium]
LAQRPDLQLQPVRGNVGTRLQLLDDGVVDALLLATAGLERLGLEQRITSRLAIADSIPAVGQGALGIECLAGDQRVLDLLAPLNSDTDSLCVAAERALSFALGASCTTPLGGYATLAADGKTLALQAVLGAPDGSRLLRANGQGSDPDQVGATVAQALLDQGAGAILEQLQALQ